MAKFIPYQSPAEFLAHKFNFIAQLRALYFENNKFDEELITVVEDPRSNKLIIQFLGGLNPLLAIGKDVVDTFKPYKSSYYVQRDFLQPLRGVITAIKGKPTLSQNLEKRVDVLEALIKKDDKTAGDAISIDKEILSIYQKARKAEARGQEIGADSEISFYYLDCERFTKRQRILPFTSPDQVTNHGYSYFASDSENKRANTLRFLRLFKVKRADINGELEDEQVFDTPKLV